MGRKGRRTRKLNGAGSITKLSGHRSKPWMVRSPAEIQIDGTVKRAVLGYYKTSEEAEIALAKYKLNPFNVDEKNTTLGELFKIWIENKKKEVTRKRSWERYSKAYDTHLKHFEDKPIRILNYNQLQTIISEPVAGTSKHLKQLLNGVYELAMKNNIVDKDISQLLEISKKKAYTREVGIFPNELIQKIRTFANENSYLETKFKVIADMVLVMLYSGLRAGEIRTIKKENVFLEENYMTGGIKTKAGIDRIIPIHPKIKDIITFYYENFPGKKYLFSQTKSNSAFAEATFVNNYIEFRDMLGFTLNRHSTRHTFITAMKRIGITESKIKKIVGHSTSDVTDGVYTHYEPKDLLIEIKKIDYGDK